MNHRFGLPFFSPFNYINHFISYMKLKGTVQTLPETRSFPCGRIFAVCTISGTRQRAYLPCATEGTHGKLNGTRQRSCLPCATKKTHGKAVDTRQCRMFAVCHDLQHTAKKTHGKMSSLPCATKDTRQNVVFAVCLFLAHGKFV